MTPEESIQLRAFARFDAIYVAILWTISFAFYIIGLNSPLVSVVSLLLTALTPFLLGARLKFFRDYGRQGVISFLRAWAYVAMTAFYGALLFSMVQYVYFAYLDNGYFLQSILQMLTDPVNGQILKQYAPNEDFGQVVAGLQSLRPIDLTISMLQTNVLVGVLLGLPIAALLRKKA